MFTGMAVKILIPALAMVITSAFTYANVAFTKWIKQKSKSEEINDALTRITHTVETTVADISQTVVAEMKEANSDGKLTKEEITHVKGLAVEQVKRQLPLTIQQTAELGINSLQTFIESKIEQAVVSQKGSS